MQKEVREQLEREIKYAKENLLDHGRGLIGSLTTDLRELEQSLDVPTDKGINDLGALQSAATIFEAKCGIVGGMVRAYKIVAGDSDGD